MKNEISPYSIQGEWAVSRERRIPRVVVTGIGMITPLGTTTEETWKNIIESKSGIQPLDHEMIARRAQMPKLYPPPHEVSAGGELPQFDIENYLAEKLSSEKFKKKDLKRMSRATQLSLATSVQALENAGLLQNGEVDERVDKERLGVTIGTCVGGMNHVAVLYDRLIENKRISPYDPLIAGLERVSTAVSIATGAEGPVETPTVACATGSLAVIRGYQDIITGDADVMIVGGTDTSLDPVTLKMFDTIGALSHGKDYTASRPFDAKRDGFVMAEGAGVLILESEEHALQRGATIIAEFAGFGKNSDAGHETNPNGRGAKNSLRTALRRSGLPDEGIIYFNAHGTSTPEGDGVEMTANREVLEEIPMNLEFAISSTKSAIGHTMGASGAIEAGIAIKALEEAVLPPTLNLEEIMEEGREINLVPNDAQAKKVGLSISGNFGFGGVGSALAFRKYYK